MIKKSLKNNLLTTASVAALGIFSAQGAFAAPGGPIVAGTDGVTVSDNHYELDASVTLVGDIDASAGVTTTPAIEFDATSAAFTLTLSGNADITGGGGNNAGADVLLVSADNTASLIVGSGTSLTSATANAGAEVIDANATMGSITINSGGSIQSTAGNGDAIVLANNEGIAAITVAGLLDADGSGNAIWLEGTGTVAGDINVSAGGKITTVTGSAIKLDDAFTSGDIINAGTLEASGAGIAIEVGVGDDATDDMTGSITNTGTIKAVGGDAIKVSGDVTGGIINGDGTTGGTISETTGRAIWFQGVAGTTTVTNKTGSSITSANVSANEATIDIDIATEVNISNAGTIENTGNNANSAAIAIDADMVGSLVNTGTIQATGAADGVAIDVGADATITNSGAILATDDSAIVLTAENTKTITNSATGTITSTANAGAGEATIQIGADLAALVNSGTITVTGGTGIAIDYTNNDITTLTNNVGGVISGATGVAIDFDADAASTITNKGTITTAGAVGAIYVSADIGTGGTINNSGTISNTGTGAGSAIDLGGTITGTLTNSGLITTSGTAAAIEGTADEAVTASLVNTGTISNTDDASTAGEAINLSTFDTTAQTITNSGTITTTATGTGVDVIWLGDANFTLTQTAGAITAASATQTAIQADAGNDTLNWYGGAITGVIDLGAGNNAINVGNASNDSISTGGTINNVDVLTVSQGTFNIGHAITLGQNTETFTINSGATAKVTSSVSVDAENLNINGGLNVANGVDLTLSSASGINEYATSNGSTVTVGISKNSDFGQIVATAGTSDFNIVTGTNLVFDVTNGSEAILAGELVDVLASDDIQVDGTTATATTLASALNVSDDSYVLGFAVSTNSDGTGLDVTITRDNAYQTASSKANESAVGTALEAIGNDGDSGLDAINGTLDSFTTAAQVEDALETLNPDMSGAINAAAVGAAEAGLGVVGNRLDQLAGISGTGVAAGGMSYNHGIWGEVFGTAADQNDRDGVKGYQADTIGFGIGGDTAISEETKIGASFAYASTEADSANGESEIDSYQFSLYGTRDYGKWFADALAGITFNSFDVKRNIVVGAISNQATADFDGHQYSLKVGGGYKLDVEGGLNVTPVASLKYDYLRLDDYTETGSTANLTVDNDDIHMLKTDLGVKLNYPIVDGSMTYIPEISTSWTYDLIGDEQEAKNNFVGAASTQFTTKGADIAQHQFNVGLGLDVLAQDNVTVSFDYDWASKEDYNSHSGAVKARFAF